MKKFFLAAGLLLFVLGIVGLVHPDFTYHKTEEVAHFGPVHATVNEENHKLLDGGFCLVEGVVGRTNQRAGFNVLETHLLA